MLTQLKTIVVSNQTIHIAVDETVLFAALAERITEYAKQCIADDGLFSMALSGGSTPKGLYRQMAQFSAEQFPWNLTYLFLGDERCVPHSDNESNYKMISDSLLSHISIPSTNVFPTINQDKDPDDSAKKYEQALQRFFKPKVPSQSASLPHFSLALMGLGGDGHTASLFPHSAALNEQTRLCVANKVKTDTFDGTRLTLTRPVFAHAKKLFFLAAGESKAQIFNDVVSHPEKGYPSQLVIGDCQPGAVEWFVDEPCARLILKE
ncbi:6-phosphogluconolactonase [soil metagenome]